MFWFDFHFGQETIHKVGGVEEDVIRQIIPDFEAAENMSCAVTCSDCDFTILYYWNDNKVEKMLKCAYKVLLIRKI